MEKADKRQSLGKNTISVLIARIAAPFLSLFLIIFIARYLGAEELGKYSLILSFLLLFQILPNLGLNYYITREVSRDNSIVTDYLIHGVILFTISSAFFALLLNLIVIFLPYSDDLKYGLFIVSFALIPCALNVLYESLLMGMERMSYLSAVNLIESVFRSLIGICAVVFLGFGFFGLVWILLISKVLSCFLLIYILKNKLPAKFIFKAKIIKNLLKEANIFFGINVFAVLNSRIDFIILSIVAGFTNLGYYSASYRIVESAGLISGAIVSAFYPVLSRLFFGDKKDFSVLFHRLLRLIALIFIPISVCLFFYADFIVSLLFSDTYKEAVNILRIMSLFSFLAALDQVLGSITLASNNQRQELNVLSTSFCCYTLLLLVLIPAYGLIGAALSTVIAMLIQTTIRFVYIYKKIFPIRLFYVIWKPLLSLMVPIFCFHLIESEIIGGTLGIVVYTLFLSFLSGLYPKNLADLKGTIRENFTYRS